MSFIYITRGLVSAMRTGAQGKNYPFFHNVHLSAELEIDTVFLSVSDAVKIIIVSFTPFRRTSFVILTLLFHSTVHRCRLVRSGIGKPGG